MKILVFDLECDDLYDNVTKIHCIVVKNYITGEVLRFGPHELNLGLDELLSADVISGQNIIDYDCPTITKLTGRTDFPRIVDTLVLSRLIYPDIQDRGVNVDGMPPELLASHSLKAWGYRLGILKGDFGEIEGFKYYKPEMLDYCEIDVEITDALLHLLASHNFSREAQNIEHDFAHLMSLQMRSGFQFDLLKGHQLKIEIESKLSTLREQLTDAIPDKVIIGKSPSMYHYPIGEDGEMVSHASKGKLRKIMQDRFKGQIPKVTIADINNTIIHGQPKITYVPFNPGSGQQRANFLKEVYGWTPKDFTETGLPKTDYDVLKQLDYPLAKPLMEYMKADKIKGMLIGSSRKDAVPWLDMVGDDGKIHGYVNPCGAVTGRTTMSKPNMGQIPSVKVDKETKELIYGMEGGYGADCRALFTVPEGMSLVGCDAKGQELRNLAHYLYQFDGGDYVKEILSGDIHVKNQTVAKLETRDEAKTFIYSYLYSCGALITGFAVSGHDLDKFVGTDYEARAHIYLDKNPIVVNGERMVRKRKGHYVLLTDEIYLRAAKGISVQENFSKNLNGFKELSEAVKHDVEANKLFGLDERHYKVRSAHKGLNVLLQGAGACQLKVATKFHYDRMTKEGLVYDRDWFLSASVYDESQQTVIDEYAEFAGQSMQKAFQEAGEYFNMNCPMDGEYKIGRTWAECH